MLAKLIRNLGAASLLALACCASSAWADWSLVPDARANTDDARPWCSSGGLGIIERPLEPHRRCDPGARKSGPVALPIFGISAPSYRGGDVQLADNNRLQIGTPVGFASQIPALSLNGLVAMALGILLGTFAAREHAN